MRGRRSNDVSQVQLKNSAVLKIITMDFSLKVRGCEIDRLAGSIFSRLIFTTVFVIAALFIRHQFHEDARLDTRQTLSQICELQNPSYDVNS